MPLADSCSSPIARGPLLAVSLRAYWPTPACTQPKTVIAKMTAQTALRYKLERPGEIAMKLNDKAPDFTLPDENGKDVSLKDFRGQNVVLFFFPKADTPG